MQETTAHTASGKLRAVVLLMALALSGAVAAGDGNGALRLPGAGAGALDLNVYGLSFHPNRAAARRLGVDNGFNPGLGLRYAIDDNVQGVTFAEAGIYHDSGRNRAKYAALGYQFHLGDRWQIGGALAAFQSRTYNRGSAFVALIPALTYDMGPVKLNAVYMPKFGRYNTVDTVGIYVSIPFRR